MKWKCSKCGHEQPRSLKTLPEEMPRCNQYLGDRSEAALGPDNSHLDRQEVPWLPEDACGGAPMPVD